jgi:hypothetical protein
MTNTTPALAFNPDYLDSTYWAKQAEVKSLSYEANKNLVEQLLANYAVELQDLTNVMVAVENVKSPRIRSNLLAHLTNTFVSDSLRITYQDFDMYSEKYLAQFFQFLNASYWGTLLSALNVNRLFLSEQLGPHTYCLTTKYIDENPKEFNAQNITEFFDTINNMVDAEKVKADFKHFVETESLSFEFLKNGKMKMTTDWISPLLMQKLNPYLFSAFYMMDKEWFMVSPNMHKPFAESFKGVVINKNSRTLILTMEKEQADMFAEFYDIAKA